MELILYIYCKWYQFDIIYDSPNLENIKQIFELISGITFVLTIQLKYQYL